MRQFPTGTEEQQRCPRCLKAAETLRHRVWECECNEDHEDYSLSAPLVSQALVNCDMNPALWLRGVPPTNHAHPEFVDPPEAEGLESLGSTSLTDLSSVGPDPLVVFPGKGLSSGFSFSWFPPGFDGCRAGEFLLR